MPDFLKTLIESESPRDVFLNASIKSIIPDLEKLHQYPKTPTLCIQLLTDASEDILIQLSEKSLALQKEYAYMRLEHFAFGKQLDTAIKTAQINMKLNSQLDAVDTLIPFYKELSQSYYLPYATLLAEHFNRLSSDKIEGLVSKIANQLSHTEYFRFNEFLLASAPNAELCQRLQAQPYNLSAYKAHAQGKIDEWIEYGEASVTSLKQKIPGFCFFRHHDTPEKTDKESKEDRSSPTP